jgi:hypothetical protein
MKRHVRRIHGGPNKLMCNLCDIKHLFSNKKQLSAHKTKVHRTKEACSHCGHLMQKGNLKRHVIEACKLVPSPNYVYDSNDDTQNTDETSNILPALQTYQEQTIIIPSTGLRRSPHYAPSKEIVQKELPEFLLWIQAPATFGKRRAIKKIGPYIDKLRTVFGKLRVFHSLTEKQLFTQLKSKRLSKRIYDMANLNKFMQTLHLAYVNNDSLNLQTVHNYAVVLVGFLRWKLFGQNLVKLSPVVDAMTEVTVQLARLKKTDIDREAKALRIKELPQIPEIVWFLNTELKKIANDVYKEYKNASMLTSDDLWLIYSKYRNFILVAMLVGIPPQRLEVFNSISITSIKIRFGYTGLSIKDHKTAYKYGPVQIVLPPSYYKEFQIYLELRNKISQDTCKNIFVNKKGEQEKNLTKIFKRLMYAKFKKTVTVRDCRSLYVTYMSKHLSLTQMYSLSQQMFHSFQTQQEIYRSENAFTKAVKSLIDTNSILQELPLHEGPIIEEIKESTIQIPSTNDLAQFSTTGEVIENEDMIYYHALDDLDELLEERQRHRVHM